jgi:hypothetical protein
VNKLKLAVGVVCLTVLLGACVSRVPDAAALGPNPGGGFYTGPNINVGQVNPPGFHEGQALAQRP